MTDEEGLLWAELKFFRKIGFAFRKQAPVGPYVADFLCRKAMLIVEVDGRYHDEPERMKSDQLRDEWLRDNGYKVLRFAAREVWNDIDSVILGIQHAIQVPPP